VLAPMSAHTMAMNATIWLEFATGMLLLVFVAWKMRTLRADAIRTQVT
jgi:hypothetical protein